MACLLKAPDGPLKGCVTFTTQERDNVINPSPDIRSQIEHFKERFVVGLHHNWHDHEFHYDPLFDFSMAGDGDLIESDGRDFARIPIDACNFAPSCYSEPRGKPFWDILYVARAVAFKGIPEFFQAIRALYDSGRTPRVLFICALPETVEIPGIENFRTHFESLFTLAERQLITFLTIDWDYPFPLDAETLAFFYRSSRIFFHSAPQERRCRTAAYAWAGKMPVVANASVASILPQKFQHPPFLFLCDGPDTMASALSRALDREYRSNEFWPDVAAEFSSGESVKRLAAFLDTLSARYGWGAVSASPISPGSLDIRLGRHHGISGGPNCVEMSVSEFCGALSTMTDDKVRQISGARDPELALRADFFGLRHETGTGATAIEGPERPLVPQFLKKLGLFRT